MIKTLKPTLLDGQTNQFEQSMDIDEAVFSTSNASMNNLLMGKQVFLDLNNYKQIQPLKEYLKIVNVKLADCLSKDINYLITNRDCTKTSTDSPLSNINANILDSPSTNRISSRMNPSNSPFIRSNSFANRAQNLLNRTPSKSFSTSNDIVSTAQRLGITVLNVAIIEKYFNSKQSISENKNQKKHEKLDSTETSEDSSKTDDLLGKNNFTLKMKNLPRFSNVKIQKLKNPYLKFESICKQYKPIYHEFGAWHEVCAEKIASRDFFCSPFHVYFTDGSDNFNKTDNSAISSSSSSPFVVQNQKTKPANSQALNNKAVNNKLKPTGYCECCKQKFDNLEQHLNGAQHENFARNLNNFKELDELIQGILNFNDYLIKNDLNNIEKQIEPESVDPPTEIPVSISIPIQVEPPASEDKTKYNKYIPVTSIIVAPAKKIVMSVTFSLEIVQVLEESYNKNKQPSNVELALLSAQLDQDMESIRVWFYERFKQDDNSTSKTVEVIKSTDKKLENVIKKSRSRTLKSTHDLMAQWEATQSDSVDSELSYSSTPPSLPDPPIEIKEQTNIEQEKIKYDFMEPVLEIQTALPTTDVLANLINNTPLMTDNLEPFSENNKYDLGTDQSCCSADIILAAFINDFTYEIVQY